MIVTPESASEPPSDVEDPALASALIVSLLAPGPMIVVVAGSVSTSGPPVRTIVRGVLPKTAGSKVMVSGPGWLLA